MAHHRLDCLKKEVPYVSSSPYRFDCSLDDFLVDDGAAAYFVGLCEKIQPGGRHLDYVTAALYIRKNRRIKPEYIERIESAMNKPRLRFCATLDQLELAKVPDEEGGDTDP